MAHSNLIIIQDEVCFGNGHIIRSQLVLEKLRKKNILIRSVTTSYLKLLDKRNLEQLFLEYTNIVVDCVWLDESLKILKTHPKVFCISPKFNQPSWVNHWLTYTQPQCVDFYGEFNIDPNFVVFNEGQFIDQNTRISSSKLMVCLSRNPLVLENYISVVNDIIATNLWDEIIIVQKGANFPEGLFVKNISVRIIDFETNNLWDNGVIYNFIVTGDGLMVREALSRGYPTISICHPNNMNKLEDLSRVDNLIIINPNLALPEIAYSKIEVLSKTISSTCDLKSGAETLAQALVKLME